MKYTVSEHLTDTVQGYLPDTFLVVLKENVIRNSLFVFAVGN